MTSPVRGETPPDRSGTGKQPASPRSLTDHNPNAFRFRLTDPAMTGRACQFTGLAKQKDGAHHYCLGITSSQCVPAGALRQGDQRGPFADSEIYTKFGGKFRVRFFPGKAPVGRPYNGAEAANDAVVMSFECSAADAARVRDTKLCPPGSSLKNGEGLSFGAGSDRAELRVAQTHGNSKLIEAVEESVPEWARDKVGEAGQGIFNQKGELCGVISGRRDKRVLLAGDLSHISNIVQGFRNAGRPNNGPQGNGPQQTRPHGQRTQAAGPTH